MDQPDLASAAPLSPKRKAVAASIVVLLFLYTLGVVSGQISKDNRIDGAHLGIIGLTLVAAALLLRPATFDRLKLLELAGFKLEMLERVREKQAEQASLLEDITFILPLLLPEGERKHLINLAEGRTADYRGGGELRTEMRRLRSVGLIRMVGGHYVGQMTSDATFDLADYVELTDLGRHWVRRIEAMEKAVPNPKLPGPPDQ